MNIETNDKRQRSYAKKFNEELKISTAERFKPGTPELVFASEFTPEFVDLFK